MRAEASLRPLVVAVGCGLSLGNRLCRWLENTKAGIIIIQYDKGSTGNPVDYSECVYM